MRKVSDYIKKYAPGPTRFSNWVVYPGHVSQGRIAMSMYPVRLPQDKPDPHYTTVVDYRELLSSFKKDKKDKTAKKGGVTIVCLQEKQEIKDLRLPPYAKEELLNKAAEGAEIEYIKVDNGLEIPDVSITKDHLVYEYVLSLLDGYNKGENYIIHCLGGHGRTGTISALLLGFILLQRGVHLTINELLEAVQWSHDQRKTTGGWKSCPQTISQFHQVEKLYYRRATSLDIKLIKEKMKIPKEVTEMYDISKLFTGKVTTVPIKVVTTQLTGRVITLTNTKIPIKKKVVPVYKKPKIPPGFEKWYDEKWDDKWDDISSFWEDEVVPVQKPPQNTPVKESSLPPKIPIKKKPIYQLKPLKQKDSADANVC